MKINDVINNVQIFGFEDSVRASKYPMSTDISKLNCDVTNTVVKLATSRQGEGHDNFLNGVLIQFDLTLSNKAWVEAERYHFLDFVSSQSTMHRITKFNLDEAYMEYVDQRIIDIMKDKVSDYNQAVINLEKVPAEDIDQRKLGKKEIDKKYLEVLYSNPCGFRLTARMTTNYRQLKTIYTQRRSHRLPEWQAFCDWLETLPNSEFITGKVNSQ